MLGSQAAVFGGVQYAMEEGEKGLVFAHCKLSKTGAGKPWGQGYWGGVGWCVSHFYTPVMFLIRDNEV